MKKLLSTLLALCMILAIAPGFVLAEEEAPEGDLVTLPVALASEPQTMDPTLNTAVDGGIYANHLFSGLATWKPGDDGLLTLVPDAAEELVEGVENEDGSYTYTYTLREGMTWSNGDPVTAEDFVYSWNRAISPDTAADYAYLYEIIDGFEDGELNVAAKDERTLEVTLKTLTPYWNELIAFPTFFPVNKNAVEAVPDNGWSTKPETYVSNGRYTFEDWEHNSVIRVKKNPNHWDADSVKVDEIEFYLSDDENNMLANYQNGTWLFIDSVPTNEIKTLEAQYPDEYKVVGQLGTYYINWNINANLLPEDTELEGAEAAKAEAEVRRAISLLLDRNYIVDEIAQAGQVPASSFVSMGLTEPDGSEFYENAGGNEGYFGYFDTSAEAYESNYAEALETFKKYYEFDEASQTVTNFPTLTYLYNTSEGHKAIGEYFASVLSAVGINVQLENQEWNVFLATRKAGDFTVARNGWICDYNDPISMIDMWVSNSGNNDAQLGKGESADVAIYNVDVTDLGVDLKVENGTWAETFDALIAQIKNCADNELRYALMHRAEDMLMETGVLTPIYYYTDNYMISPRMDGFFSSPLGMKFFYACTISD